MPADERRAAILDAALPLVRAAGRGVRAADVAREAGVSEATVFHVFGTKDALIDAVVEREFTTDSTHRLLAAVDLEAELQDRLVAVVTVLRERLHSVFQLMSVLGLSRPPRVPGHDHRPRHAELLETVADVLRADADQLRYPPERTAELVRLITFATTHPLITDGRPLDTDEIAELILHGVLGTARKEAPC